MTLKGSKRNSSCQTGMLTIDVIASLLSFLNCLISNSIKANHFLKSCTLACSLPRRHLYRALQFGQELPVDPERIRNTHVITRSLNWGQ